MDAGKYNNCFDRIRGAALRRQCLVGDIVSIDSKRRLKTRVTQVNSVDDVDYYLIREGYIIRKRVVSALKTFPKLDTFLEGKNIEIIDYGSGMGVAVVVLIDFLQKLGFVSQVCKIVLFQKERVMLNRGLVLVKKVMRLVESNVSPLGYVANVDEMDFSFLEENVESVKFHLFSGVLDENCLSTRSLFDNLRKHVFGRNYFICTGPVRSSCNISVDVFSFLFCILCNGIEICHRNDRVFCRNNDMGVVFSRYDRNFVVVRSDPAMDGYD